MASEEPIRKPCLHCAEPASISAQICPHCSNSLLVDVRLERGLVDPRQSHQLARMLSRLSPSASFIEVKRMLGTARPTVMQRVTRETAEAALHACAEFGLEGRAEIATREKSAMVNWSNAPVKWIGVASGILLAFFLGWWALSSSDATTDEASALSDVSVGPLPTQQIAASAGSLPTEQIATAAGPSTVSLSCLNSVGSAFFVTENTLITNAHVMCKDSDRIRVHFSDGRELDGREIRRDEDLDLALVEVDGAGAAPLALGDAAGLRPGEKIVVIGTPLGMDYTVHEGIVSHVGRTVYGVSYIQIDANINPGNSGGPLLNQQGEVVGVVSMKHAGGEGLGFALPINYAYASARPIFDVHRTPSEAWRQMLAAAAEAEERDLAEVRSTLKWPGLSHVQPTPRGLGVIVVMRSRRVPRPEKLAAYLEVKGTAPCRGYIDILGWGSLDAMMQDREVEVTAEVRWLRKHGLANDFWYGTGLFDLARCRSSAVRGSEVVLVDGAPGHDRMPTGIE